MYIIYTSALLNFLEFIEKAKLLEQVSKIIKLMSFKRAITYKAKFPDLFNRYKLYYLD